MVTVTEIVTSMIEGGGEFVSSVDLGIGPSPVAPKPTAGIPTSLAELNQQVSRTYDLSVTAAGQLSIPVVGSVSGGFDRRVVVLERKAYKEITENQIKYQYGYAIRLAITVNKITGGIKLTLPFLAASAEVGTIEGKWILQVAGLAGPKIDAAILPPTELRVETFVLAKQSLTKVINAINHATTTFSAVQVGVVKPPDVVEREYRISIGRAYALGRIEKGRSIRDAIDDIETGDDVTRDTISDTYKEYAGITDANVKPSDHVRNMARTTLGNVKVEPR
jgi:hypothetical protein